MKRYSSRQLVLAKCAVVALSALIAGPFLADGPNEVAVSILALAIVVSVFIGAYEGLAHALAAVLGRLWRDGTPPEQPPAEQASPLQPYRASAQGPRPGDVLHAVLAFLAGQGLVWFIVGIAAARRVGMDVGHATFIRALLPMVPVALPGSLVAGGLALLLVLRGWQRRFGASALQRILGLSWGSARQIAAGALAGAVVVIVVLPLAALEPNRAAPPDLLTQLAVSSRAALRAWMISAVILAPPIEELMFRGVLLGSLAENWSLRGAALVSGVTFWLMHAPEFVHWPAAVSIAVLTILVTWLRVRTRSLGPSIAAHFAYNLLLAVFMSLALAYKTEEPKWAQSGPTQPTRQAAMR